MKILKKYVPELDDDKEVAFKPLELQEEAVETEEEVNG
jgi:hypothetical protein